MAGEVTKLSLQNAKLEKEMLAARELANSRNMIMQNVNGVNRKYGDGIRSGRKGRHSARANELSGVACDELELWNLDPDDFKMELQARKQRETALEAALAEKEFVEEEYRKKVEEAKRREEALENDLANMWVLVAKLKKEGGAIPVMNGDERLSEASEIMNELKVNDTVSSTVPKERQISDVSEPTDEPLVVRLKVSLNFLYTFELYFVELVS